PALDLAAPPDEEAVAAEPAPEPPEELASAPPAAPSEPPPVAWQPLVLAVWIGGPLVWLALAGRPGRRLAPALRCAEPAPAWLQRESDGLAARLGLARAPGVRLLPGRVSPMLWAPGRAARLLLPSELLGRLDAGGRRTLLAHELAHLPRRDHR